MRQIAKIISIERRLSKDNLEYYVADIIDSEGDESNGYLIGVGNEVEVFHNERWDKTEFIVKKKNKHLTS